VRQRPTCWASGWSKKPGPKGCPSKSVYVESGSEIEREIYLSLTLNRERGRIAVIASEAGGMDIEEVAEHSPEKILRADINPTAGLQPYQCRKLAFGLGFKGPQVGKFQSILMALYRIYLERDAALLEVNPLIVTKTGELMALDAKFTSMRTRSSGRRRSPPCATLRRKIDRARGQ
jgi:succinyl-CoA synthetase beta subunit